jgi:hypothetical protein
LASRFQAVSGGIYARVPRAKRLGLPQEPRVLFNEDFEHGMARAPATTGGHRLAKAAMSKLGRLGDRIGEIEAASGHPEGKQRIDDAQASVGLGNQPLGN